MRHPSETYFVRLSPDAPTEGQGAPGRSSRKARDRIDTRPTSHKRRRRRQVSGKKFFLVLLVVGLGTWAYWASQQPGGVSGTVSGWISHVRGDVASVSSDPDAAKARRYLQGQYQATGRYPQMSDSDLTSIGVGVGVTVEYCSSQAAVIQGAAGADFESNLLLSGKDLGEVPGRVNCPASFQNPAPWKLPKS